MKIRYVDTRSATPMSVLSSFRSKVTGSFYIYSTERLRRHDDETIVSASLILSSAVKLEAFSKIKKSTSRKQNVSTNKPEN